MQLMILVDDAGEQWPMISHAPWNGCNLADFVMPFFLFIVGMAIPLALKVSYKRMAILECFKYLDFPFLCFLMLLFYFQRIPNRLLAVKKVLVRTLRLLFWGILLQG